MTNFNNPFDAFNILTGVEILALTQKPEQFKSLGNDGELMGYVGRVVAPTGQRVIFENTAHAIAALKAYAKKISSPFLPKN
jgi:hypothetical protein